MAILTITTTEVCCVLLGEFRDGIWHAKMSWRRKGTHDSVMFDGKRVLAREERYGDVVGFYHTHPEGITSPSDRDLKTMRAWAFCFGKPLLCAIATGVGVRGWRFDCSAEDFEEVDTIGVFKNNWLVAAVGERA